MAFYSPLMNVMIATVTKAGRNLRRDFGEIENLQTSQKGIESFVKSAFDRSNDILRKELDKARPVFGFWGETPPAAKTDVASGRDRFYSWIINPLAGIRNFAHGVPHFAISIAVARDDDPVAASIYNPVTDTMYWAEAGTGAFCGDRRMRVSGRHDLASAMVGTYIPNIKQDGGDVDDILSEMRAIAPHVAGISCLGTPTLDLAYVAAGRFDAFWHNNLPCQETAAGIVLIREAGGFVTSTDKRRDLLHCKNIVAGNQTLQAKLRVILEN